MARKTRYNLAQVESLARTRYETSATPTATDLAEYDVLAEAALVARRSDLLARLEKAEAVKAANDHTTARHQQAISYIISINLKLRELEAR